jgi:hypothetical protein
MPRQPRRNLNFLGPTAICDACGKPGWDCHVAGLPCFFCSDGLFMHRKFWVYTPCPDCGYRNIFCETCRGAGVIATPREEVTAEEVRDAYLEAAENFQRYRGAVPALIAERLRERSVPRLSAGAAAGPQVRTAAARTPGRGQYADPPCPSL